MCSNMKRLIVSVNTCNTENFGIDTHPNKVKAFTLTATGYPSANGFTKRTYLIEYEDTDFMKYEGPRIITLFGKKVRVLGIRRLTPTECSRLQTIPTWYKWECSDSQEYRMLGNGWTIEVIKHIFSFLPDAWKKKSEIGKRIKL